MFSTLVNAFKNKEIRRNILITLALLFLYRLGCWIPVPGIDNASLIVEGNELFGLLSAIGGEALSNGALLAIGISPYINASIIVQLLTIAIPPLERLTKQGEDGKRKIANITRFVTLGLAIAQAVGISLSWYNATGSLKPIFGTGTNELAWVAVIVAGIMVAGAMFTTWLGERITEYNVGNGMSLLIFVGIISSAGLALLAQFKLLFGGSGDEQNKAMWSLIAFALAVLLIFIFIVWIDLAERRIPVNYARQIKGRKQYGGQATHIPIKINANGVLPIIFATALVTFPQIIFQLIFGTGGPDVDSKGAGFYRWWSTHAGAGSWLYIVLMVVLIFFFSYFYSMIQFKPDEVARNLQQYGGTLTGIRPGKPTADYLGRVSKRLTLFGAIFLSILATIPTVIFKAADFVGSSVLTNAFTATGLLIVVSVALEINKQLESQLMMKHYKGFLK